MSIKDIKNKVKPILERHSVKRAAIFGSYARGQENKKSDIDILIEYKNDNKTLLDFVELKLELEKILGQKVDLVEYSEIKPRIREKILEEQLSIL